MTTTTDALTTRRAAARERLAHNLPDHSLPLPLSLPYPPSLTRPPHLPTVARPHPRVNSAPSNRHPFGAAQGAAAGRRRRTACEEVVVGVEHEARRRFTPGSQAGSQPAGTAGRGSARARGPSRPRARRRRFWSEASRRRAPWAPRARARPGIIGGGRSGVARARKATTVSTPAAGRARLRLYTPAT